MENGSLLERLNDFLRKMVVTDIEPILHILREQMEDTSLDEEDRVMAERLIAWLNHVKRDQRRANIASRRMLKHARRHKEALRKLGQQRNNPSSYWSEQVSTSEIHINKVEFFREDDNTSITDLSEVENVAHVMRLYYEDEDGKRIIEYNRPRTVFDGVVPQAGDILIKRMTADLRTVTLIDGQSNKIIYEKIVDLTRSFPITAKERQEKETIKSAVQNVIDRMKKNAVYGARGQVGPNNE